MKKYHSMVHSKVVFVGYAMLICAGFACSEPASKSTEHTVAPTTDTVSSASNSAGANDASYVQRHSLFGTSFTVTSAQQANGNTLTITPEGLAATNEPITIAIEGKVLRSDINDLDADGSAEVLVVTSGDGKSEQAYLFSVNSGKSLGMVSMPDLTSIRQSKNYGGGEAYNLVENRVVMRFPLMEAGTATGRFRQFQYKLAPGEAMKKLVLDKQVEF